MLAMPKSNLFIKNFYYYYIFIIRIYLSKQMVTSALSDREEEEYSDLPACRISETVSSLVLKLGLHIVVGSSRLDNHSQ